MNYFIRRFPSPLQYQFRADPRLPSGTFEEGNEANLEPEYVETDAPLARVNNCHWCTCRKCKPMPTLDESVCCKEIKNNPQLLSGINDMNRASKRSSLSDLECLCRHELVGSILNREILRIQLLTLWDSTRSSADISNRFNNFNI